MGCLVSKHLESPRIIRSGNHIMFKPITRRKCPLFFDAQSFLAFMNNSSSHELRQPNPDVDQIPDSDHEPLSPDLPPDIDRRRTVRVPPDQPGLPEDNQPDPPPQADPPQSEPTRLLDSRSDRAPSYR